jgi:DNA-binding response OmpR family regulator
VIAASAKSDDPAQVEQVAPGRVLRVGPLAIDTYICTVTPHGKRVELHRIEHKLLAHLASNPDRVFSSEELLRVVWEFRLPGNTRTVDSHTSRLRRKLGIGGEHWVVTIRGRGYRLRANP